MDDRIGKPVYTRRPEMEMGKTYAERVAELEHSNHPYKDVLMESYKQYQKHVRLNSAIRG